MRAFVNRLYIKGTKIELMNKSILIIKNVSLLLILQTLQITIKVQQSEL